MLNTELYIFNLDNCFVVQRHYHKNIQIVNELIPITWGYVHGPTRKKVLSNKLARKHKKVD